MAIASTRVRADCVQAQEFPDLSQRYQVMGVPRTVGNEQHALEGAVPEAAFLAFVQQVAGGESA
jgi:predicted DsbA family dithiol-disulfide isomerase